MQNVPQAGLSGPIRWRPSPTSTFAIDREGRSYRKCDFAGISETFRESFPPSLRMVSDIPDCDARTMASTIWLVYYIGITTCPHSDSSFLSSFSPPSRLSPRLLRASPRRLNPYPPTPTRVRCRHRQTRRFRDQTVEVRCGFHTEK
jgi:hypothetical protein